MLLHWMSRESFLHTRTGEKDFPWQPIPPVRRPGHFQRMHSDFDVGLESAKTTAAHRLQPSERATKSQRAVRRCHPDETVARAFRTTSISVTAPGFCNSQPASRALLREGLLRRGQTHVVVRRPGTVERKQRLLASLPRLLPRAALSGVGTRSPRCLSQTGDDELLILKRWRLDPHGRKEPPARRSLSLDVVVNESILSPYRSRSMNACVSQSPPTGGGRAEFRLTPRTNLSTNSSYPAPRAFPRYPRYRGSERSRSLFVPTSRQTGRQQAGWSPRGH